MRTAWLLLGIALPCLVATGCTRRYRPAEYVIATDRIGAFPSEGPVRIVGEPSPVTEARVFSSMGSGWMANYGEVTSALVAQLTKELTKRGVVVSDAAAKTIRVTVLEMAARDVFFALEGSMTVRVQLGDASPITLQIANKSPANIYRALNGTIARAVIAILTNSDVQAYLAGSSATGRGESDGILRHGERSVIRTSPVRRGSRTLVDAAAAGSG